MPNHEHGLLSLYTHTPKTDTHSTHAAHGKYEQIKYKTDLHENRCVQRTYAETEYTQLALWIILHSLLEEDETKKKKAQRTEWETQFYPGVECV